MFGAFQCPGSLWAGVRAACASGVLPVLVPGQATWGSGFPKLHTAPDCSECSGLPLLPILCCSTWSFLRETSKCPWNLKAKKIPAACNKNPKQYPVMKIYWKTLYFYIAPLRCVLKGFRKEGWRHCLHFTARKTEARGGKRFLQACLTAGRGRAIASPKSQGRAYLVLHLLVTTKI